MKTHYSKTARQMLVLLAVAATAAACATTDAKGDDGPTGATLEIINRTDAEMWVSVRGRVEATVQEKQRAILRHLTPGDAVVRVAPTPEEVAAKSSRDLDVIFDKSVTLEEGKRAVVDVYRPGAAAPLPPPLGDLAVDNQLTRDVQIWVDGESLGLVLAGSKRVIRDVVSGVRSFRAADRGQKSVFTKDLDVKANGQASWLLKAPEAVLRVINDTEEAVWVTADDRDLGRIAPGMRLSVKDLGVGKHFLLATGETSKHRYQKVMELTSDFPAVWGLSSGSATLVVVNLTGEDITAVPTGNLVPSSARTLSIPAGAQYRVDDVVPSVVGINAVTAKTNTLHKMEVELRPGQVFRWEILPASSGVRVVNRTTEELTLYVGKTKVGQLRPGASRSMTALPKGATTLEAYSKHKHRYQLSLPPAPRQPVSWTIRAATGGIAVVNERSEPLSVYVDARRVGTVAAKGTVNFSGIPIGKRLVEASGQKTKTSLKARTEVSRGGIAEVRFKDPRAMLTVVNRSGERLEAKGLLASQRPMVEKDGRVHFNLPAGRRELVFMGRDSGLAYRKLADFVEEAKVVWTIDKPMGSLVIQNALEETVAISVDGVPKGTILKGTNLALGPMPAVRHRIVAEGLKSKRLWQVDRRIQPNKALFWNLVDSPSRLLVKNLSQETVQLVVDNRPYGIVPPQSNKVFANLQPGKRTVYTVGMTSRVKQDYTVPLEAGRTDVLVVHPPFGTIMVDNLSGEDLVVRVGNKKVGRIAAGKMPTPVPVPAGLRLVQIERQGSRTVTTYRLQVTSRRSIHLEVMAIAARAAIKNATDKPLTVFAGDRQLGVVAPGESLMVDDLKAGAIRFKAIDSKGTTTHAERRTLGEGELFGWELR